MSLIAKLVDVGSLLRLKGNVGGEKKKMKRSDIQKVSLIIFSRLKSGFARHFESGE